MSLGRAASYLLMFQTIALGFCYVFLAHTKSVAASTLYKFGVAVIGTHVWSILVLTFGLLCLLAFMKLKWFWTEHLAGLLFVLWVFAGATYVIHGYVLPLLVTAIPQALFYVGLFVQSILNRK